MPPYRYLFGPVPSRRLGRSLGVDLLPQKTCTADCVFCQLGHSVHQTAERKEYVPIEAVLAELRDWLPRGETADYVTLAGSGEPTLHSRFGAVLELVRRDGRFASALLSNGMLFYLPEVRAAAALASVVKVALSAWDQPSFERINRPLSTLRLDRLLDGYRAFRAQYSGQLWLEVFLVEGLNSDPDQVSRIARLARTIAPDRIHLNTAIRPPAEPSVAALSEARLRSLTPLFEPPAEVIAEFGTAGPTRAGRTADDIGAVLKRHPATVEQLAGALGIAPAAAAREIECLLQAGRITARRQGAAVYYRAREPGKA